MTIEEARERVSRGAAWLDDREPDWASRIEISSLDMSQPCFCVLGQLYRNYWAAVRNAGWLVPTSPIDKPVVHPDNIPYQYGFGASGREPGWEGLSKKTKTTYALLQAAWVEAISERLAPVVTWTPRDRVQVPV